MLRAPVVAQRRTAFPLARAFREGRIGLRISLAVVAVVYVVAPTVVQWAALADERAEVVAQRTVVSLPDAMEDPAQASKPLADFISQQMPERFREYVPAGLAAVAGASDTMVSRWQAVGGALLRGIVVAMAGVIAVVAGARLGRPYRPRHARTGPVSRVFIS